MAFLSQKSAARHCKVSRDTFRRWCAAGVVPSWSDPVTGTVWYTTEALDAWMANPDEAQAS